MRTKRLPVAFTLTIVLVLLFQATSYGQMQEQLDGIRQKYGLMGLSLAVVSHGSTVELFHSGIRDYGRNLPVNDSTCYRVASISKMVTTTAMMILHDRGIIDPEDDISRHLGYVIRNPRYPEIPITVGMLLSHTGSINEGTGYERFLADTYNNVGNPPSFSELLIPGGKYYTEDMWRNEPPGTFFSYCNANFGLTGTVIEKVTGKRFESFMKESLFDPMDISAAFTVEGLSDVDNLAVIYRNENGSWVPQTDDLGGKVSSPRDFSGYVTGTNAAVYSPQGGLRISAADLAKIMVLHLHNGRYDGRRIVSSKSIRLMRTPAWSFSGNNGDNYNGQFMVWGMGMHITDGKAMDAVWEGIVMPGHGGDAYGLISDFYFDPESGSGFVFITNGIFNPLTASSSTSFYDFEDAVFRAVRSYVSERGRK